MRGAHPASPAKHAESTGARSPVLGRSALRPGAPGRRKSVWRRFSLAPALCMSAWRSPPKSATPGAAGQSARGYSQAANTRTKISKTQIARKWRCRKSRNFPPVMVVSDGGERARPRRSTVPAGSYLDGGFPQRRHDPSWRGAIRQDFRPASLRTAVQRKASVNIHRFGVGMPTIDLPWALRRPERGRRYDASGVRWRRISCAGRC